MKKGLLLIALLIVNAALNAQVKEIKLEDERKANRIFIYGVNETLQDLDVTLTVEGTGFRQSNRKPRAIRVPATSRVNLLMLIVNRGEEPNYKPTLIVTDSLSRRALRKESKLIKIDPPKPINFYVTESCKTCDTLIATLERSPYRYTATRFAEKPEIKKQVQMAIPTLDTVSNAIINLKGTLLTDIETFEELMMKLKE